MKRNNPEVITLVTLILALLMLETLAQYTPMIRPISYTLPPPPALVGPLSTNNVLSSAEKVHQKQIKGPTSFVNHNGHLFASTRDAKIYDLASCPPKLIANLATPGCFGSYNCGWLTSLRRDPATGYLMALDTFRGLYAVNPTTGKSQLVYSTNTPVQGRTPVHLNDMVVTPDGVIIISDSSDAYNINNDIYICMDGRPTGRLLAFYPRTGRISEIKSGLFNFPNGLEMTPEGDLLVAETCRATIHKVSLNRASWLQVSPFSVNLPGMPDNIRASGRGTYWVALSYPRHASVRSPLDENSRIPDYRAMGFQYMSLREIRAMFIMWAIVVELDATGTIIGSLHDPTGVTVNMTTEVNEFGGVLNIGSHLLDYMVRVILPPEAGIKTSVESFIQIKRSRCELPDNQVETVRRQLLQEQRNSTASSPLQQFP